MFGQFSRKHWKQKSSHGRRSPFGGVVKSMEEVDALNRQILAHEKKEEAVADKMLDTEWKKVEKKIKK